MNPAPYPPLIPGEIPSYQLRLRFLRRFPKRKGFSQQPGIKRLLADEILFRRKNTKFHLSLSLFLQEQAVKSWDLPSEELVAYRYENVTPLFFPFELACCISVPEAYTQLLQL